jgi:hypothetical protein
LSRVVRNMYYKNDAVKQAVYESMVLKRMVENLASYNNP